MMHLYPSRLEPGLNGHVIRRSCDAAPRKSVCAAKTSPIALGMGRILLVIALAILLLPARHSNRDLPVRQGALLVDARRLLLDGRDPSVRSVGPFRWLGSWELISKHRDFGGISSMIADDEDGSLLTLSDGAALVGMPMPGIPVTPRTHRPFIAPLPVRPAEREWPNWKWDSESMIHDPESGRYWVGFELIQRICRYSPGFARIESCASPPEMRAWPKTGSVEAMVRLVDGRFLLFSEMAPSGQGYAALLFDGDPAEPGTPPPHHLVYRPPQGFRPTDAVVLGPRRLLVLNRRVTLYDGFTATVALVDLPPLHDGVELVAKPLALLAPPLLADNFEAMALSHERGGTVLWIASDDNHQFFQRSLLLKFAVPASLIR